MKRYTPANLRQTLVDLKESIDKDKNSLKLLKRTPVKATMSKKLLNMEINKKKLQIVEIKELLNNW